DSKERSALTCQLEAGPLRAIVSCGATRPTHRPAFTTEEERSSTREPTEIPGEKPPAHACDLPSKFSHARRSPAVVHATRERMETCLIALCPSRTATPLERRAPKWEFKPMRGWESTREDRTRGPRMHILCDVRGSAKHVPTLGGPR